MPSGTLTKYKNLDLMWEDSCGYSTLKEARITIKHYEGNGYIDYIIQFLDDHNRPYNYDLKIFIDTPMGKMECKDKIIIHKHNENKVAIVPADYELNDDEGRINFDFFEWNAEDWN